MSVYPINEIFYSLQGEGFFAGMSSIFIRFSGCNLKCPFCDTNHQFCENMSLKEILEKAMSFPSKHVVLTGGEPSLFVDSELVKALHKLKKFVAIETNGTHILPKEIDWITLSPKKHYVDTYSANVVLNRCNELKVVFESKKDFYTYDEIDARHRFVQPKDTGDVEMNKQIMSDAIEWCLSNPEWRLSLQTHKLIGIK